MDSLEFDVKRALVKSPSNRMQWHNIRDELFGKYTQYDKASFTTILNRKIQKMNGIEKESLGHQQVFYFISKNYLKKVTEETDRELAHRRFDEIWDTFTSEQRKRELKYLLNQRLMPGVIYGRIGNDLLSFFEEQFQDYITRLENPSEDISKKYSPPERKKYLKELANNLSDIKKFKSNPFFKKQDISDEKFTKLLSLTKEFTEKIVEPKYAGRMDEAIQDLMRKAIQEEENKKLEI